MKVGVPSKGEILSCLFSRELLSWAQRRSVYTYSTDVKVRIYGHFAGHFCGPWLVYILVAENRVNKSAAMRLTWS